MTDLKRTGAFLALALVFLMLSGAPANADITRSARVELTDNSPRIFIGPQTYLNADQNSKLNAKAIAARYQNNLKGARQARNIINLGAKTEAVWLAFSVTNNASYDDWVLHFGDIFDGQFGFIEDIQIYNASENKTLIQSAIHGQDALNLNKLQNGAVALNIPTGKKQLFVVYLKMTPGAVHTLAPSFMTVQAYQARLSGTGVFEGILWMLILSGIGIFLAFSIIQKRIVFIFFSVHLLSYAALIYGFDGSFFLAGSLSNVALGALLILPTLIAIFTTQRFLDLQIGHDSLNMMLLMSAAAVVFGFILSQVLGGAETSIDEYLIFIPLLLSAAFLCALSFTQAQQERHGGFYMAGAWLCAFIGLISLFLVALDGGSAAMLICCYWGMLLPQTGLLIMAALQNLQMTQQEELSSFARDNRAAQSLARIKQSKESADQARLLRVIERERELMAELREREMQRTQEMRKARNAADEANRAKSAFLAVVSHEIRTPMNGILGMLRLLIDTKMSKDQTDYVQAIQNSGDTMMALLNDILDFEKIESGNMEIEIIDFDMMKLIEGVVTLMSGHAADKRLALKADISADFPATLKGDPTRLRQVLLNLISNAVKFTAHGTVEIQLSAQPAAKTEEDGAFYDVTCAVKDTGIGISEEVQKNLFNPFTQADKSTSRKYGGTGLGLAICRRLIEAMGSSIQLQSRENEGSSFFFTLKMEQGQKDFGENAQDVAYNAPTRAEIEPMHILVVDDNEINRRVLEGFLSKDSHYLTMLESAEEALELCKSAHFDAVITDIHLLGMDGMDFTRHLRKFDDQEIAATPVIALSGDVSAEDRKAYEDAGMDGFLAKPIDPQALFDALVEIAESPKTAAPMDAHAEEAILQEQKAMIAEDVKSGGFENIDLDDDFDSFDFDGDEAEGETGDTNPIEAKQHEVQESAGLFDPKLLEGLVQSLPKDQFDELLQSFLEKTDELVDILCAAEDNEADMEEVSNRAHELKGMAANFGLTSVSDIAKTIEAAAKEGRRADAFEAADKIAAVNIEAQAALVNWVKLQQA